MKIIPRVSDLVIRIKTKKLGFRTATFVTNSQGFATQFFLNLPFGETFVEQQVTGKYENPYKFNAKELDSETGLYYYGARYYNPRFSIWYGVDPLAEKYPSWSPYNYTLNNPVNLIDPDGRSPLTDYKLQNGKIERVDSNDKSEGNLNDRLFIYDKDGKQKSNQPFTISKENKNSATMISDLSIVRENTVYGSLRYTQSNNLGQALDLYQYVALNSGSEWSFENHKGKAIFGSFNHGFFSPNFSDGAYAVSGFSEKSLTYDIHSHGTEYGTNGPSSSYDPNNRSDMANPRNENATRFIFRTNNNPNKAPEKGSVWQYGKDMSTPVKLQENFTRTRFSSLTMFNP